jgi:hypothetical protein
VSFVNIFCSDSHIDAQRNFYPYFPHILSDMGETRNKRQVHIMLLNVFEFREDTCNEAVLFLSTHMKLHLGVYCEYFYTTLCT